MGGGTMKANIDELSAKLIDQYKLYIETLSSAVLDGRGEECEPEPNPLHALSGPEVEGLVSRCAAALHSHGIDFHAGHDRDGALAAFESAMALLLDLRDIHPSHRANIDAVLVRFGYPVPEH
jgi:hypothetical protein